MRRPSRHVEGLAPASFSVLIATVGGALQGIPRFFLGSTSHIGQFVLVAVTSVLWWAAALLLWWIAVRRQRWSVWTTAGHVTLGLALASLLEMALTAVVASIETKGKFAAAVARAPLIFASSNLALVLIRSVVWFFGSAMLIALGRHLVGGESSAATWSAVRAPPPPGRR